MSSVILGDDLDKLWPLIGDGASDSGTFDNALELLMAGGYSLAHAMMLMIPEAWADNPLMDPERKAFYEYHASMMEPWDGPAAVAFSDGIRVGAMLDREFRVGEQPLDGAALHGVAVIVGPLEAQFLSRTGPGIVDAEATAVG